MHLAKAPLVRAVSSVFVACAVLVISEAVSPIAGAAQGRAAQGRVIPGAVQQVLPERDRASIVNKILTDRLENLLPKLMREQGIDLWLVINREYVEDPVYLTLVPEPVFHARRLSMLVFYDRGPEKGVERLTVSRYAMTGYTAAWQGGTAESQWKRLVEIINERNPKKIGINSSRQWSFGDGLTSGLRESLDEALGADLRAKVTSADKLCVRWLETRTPAELDLYASMTQIARGVISEAFSERVITPGVTTTDDVAWYIRQRWTDLGLGTWFFPTVDLQRAGTCGKDAAFCDGDGVIERGDVLHCDVGIRYLRLNTDTQEMGYVLRRGETDVPAGLKKALADGNRWQDVLTGAFKVGRTGDEVFKLTDAGSKKEGLQHSTYSHAVGFHGHAAGPAIGMWDNQTGPVPVTGSWPLAANTAYAIEGNVKVAVPEWKGQLVQIKLEQTALFDGTMVTYAAGRQTDWHIVR
jgi:Xaa-Pro aminopeptidase